jgi:rRNA-processing protein FCF1
MMDPVKQLLTYSRIGVVVDSNLLVLLFLGTYDRRQIATNARLSRFNEEDYEILIHVLTPFEHIVTTPNILTEVSNLSNAIPETSRETYFASFASRLALLEEQHVASSTALQSRWAKFGLTDAVIATIAKNRYLVLTDDFRLSQSLQSDGIDTLNFNHLRETYWQMKG